VRDVVRLLAQARGRQLDVQHLDSLCRAISVGVAADLETVRVDQLGRAPGRATREGTHIRVVPNATPADPYPTGVVSCATVLTRPYMSTRFVFVVRLRDGRRAAQAVVLGKEGTVAWWPLSTDTYLKLAGDVSRGNVHALCQVFHVVFDCAVRDAPPWRAVADSHPPLVTPPSLPSASHTDGGKPEFGRTAENVLDALRRHTPSLSDARFAAMQEQRAGQFVAAPDLCAANVRAINAVVARRTHAVRRERRVFPHEFRCGNWHGVVGRELVWGTLSAGTTFLNHRSNWSEENRSE